MLKTVLKSNIYLQKKGIFIIMTEDDAYGLEEKFMTDNTYKNDENIGNVQISEQVVAVIAGIAATEVEGVVSLIGNITTELVAKMGGSNLGRGVAIKMVNKTVFVTVTINIDARYSIRKVSEEVQEKVSAAITTMTGLDVAEVNVTIADVSMGKNS